MTASKNGKFRLPSKDTLFFVGAMNCEHRPAALT